MMAKRAGDKIKSCPRFRLKSDLRGVNWVGLAEVYERPPLGKRDPKQPKKAFHRSYATCIALHTGRPVAAARRRLCFFQSSAKFLVFER